MKTTTTVALVAIASGAFAQCPTKGDSRYQWVQTTKGIEVYVDLSASNDESWAMILSNRSAHFGIHFRVVGPAKLVNDYAPIPRGDCCSIVIGKDEKVQIQ